MKSKNLWDNKSGLTLVEVMAAILILSIVTVSLYAVYDYSVSSYNWGDVYAQNQDSGRFVMQKLTKTTRNGFDVNISDNGRSLNVLTDGKLTDSFNDFRFWNWSGAPPEIPDKLVLTLEAGVAGAVYQETTSPYALIKPTNNGRLQVEVDIDASMIQQGSAASLFLISPKTEEGKTKPNELNNVGITIDGGGNLTITENVYGIVNPVVYSKYIGLAKTHKLRIGLEPTGYNSLTHKITLYLDNILIYPEKPGDTRPREKSHIIDGNEYGWVGENNLAFVRLELKSKEIAPQESKATWKNFKIFYNSYKYYYNSHDKILYYQKNEESPLAVANRVGNFKATKQDSDPIIDIEITLGDLEKEKNRLHILRSSVTYQRR